MQNLTEMDAKKPTVSQKYKHTVGGSNPSTSATYNAFCIKGK